MNDRDRKYSAMWRETQWELPDRSGPVYVWVYRVTSNQGFEATAWWDEDMGSFKLKSGGWVNTEEAPFWSYKLGDPGYWD